MSLKWQQCQHSHSQLFRLIPLHSIQISLLALSLTVSFPHFIFLGQFPLSIIPFYKMLCGLISGDKEPIQPHVLLSAGKLSNRCVTIIQWQTLNVTWLVTDNDVYLLLYKDSWTGELAIKSVLYVITRLISGSKWNRNHIAEELVSLS